MIMTRYFMDCRNFPGATKCSVAFAADTKEELLEAVFRHETEVHGCEDTPEFRVRIMRDFREGTPPLKV